MNDELCNPALWSTTGVVSSHSSNGVNGDASDSLHQAELGGGALEDARLRYKSAVASLRSVLTAIPSYPRGNTEPESYESGTIVGDLLVVYVRMLISLLLSKCGFDKTFKFIILGIMFMLLQNSYWGNFQSMCSLCMFESPSGSNPHTGIFHKARFVIDLERGAHGTPELKSQLFCSLPGSDLIPTTRTRAGLELQLLLSMHIIVLMLLQTRFGINPNCSVVHAGVTCILLPGLVQD